MAREREAVTVLDIRTAEDRAQWSIPESIHIDAYNDLKQGMPALSQMPRSLLGADRDDLQHGDGKPDGGEVLRARGLDALFLEAA